LASQDLDAIANYFAKNSTAAREKFSAPNTSNLLPFLTAAKVM
jgi:hypothetical protein